MTIETISAGRKQNKPKRNHSANGRPFRDAITAGMHASPTATMNHTTKKAAERPLLLVVYV